MSALVARAPVPGPLQAELLAWGVAPAHLEAVECLTLRHDRCRCVWCGGTGLNPATVTVPYPGDGDCPVCEGHGATQGPLVAEIVTADGWFIVYRAGRITRLEAPVTA